jgi:hypothetical protein
MIGQTGAGRTNFSYVTVKTQVDPMRDRDSRLRKMVLNRNMAP